MDLIVTIVLCLDFLNAPRWRSIEWLDNLRKGSDKNSCTSRDSSKVTLENKVHTHYCMDQRANAVHVE